jgi:hypothetical protein
VGEALASSDKNVSRRRVWLIAVVAWCFGLMSAVLGGLIVNYLQDRLEGPGLQEELRQYVSDKRAHGKVVVVDRRADIAGLGVPARVLVLRDRRAKQSDELVVLEERGDDLREAFTFQPRADVGRFPRFEASPTAAVRVPDSDGAERIPRSRRDFRPVLTSRFRYRYLLRYEDAADFTGTGETQLLFALQGPLSFLRYPMVLSHDPLTGSYKVTPVMPGRVEVSPRPVYSEDDYTHDRHLYRRPPQVIRLVGPRQKPIRSAGAHAFALIRAPDGLYLAAAFVVAWGGVGVSPDLDCGLDVPPAGGQYGCGGLGERVGVPKFANMKAWRFEHQGAKPDVVFCDGPATIIRLVGADAAPDLRRNWRRYIRVPRFC